MKITVSSFNRCFRLCAAGGLTALILISTGIHDAAAEKIPSALTMQNQPLNVYFNALSVVMERPVIVSKKTQSQLLSGVFDLSEPMQSLRTISREMGLIWYFDGHAVYIYRQDEIGSTLVRLENMRVDTLVSALRMAGIYDERYELNAKADDYTFYISGPPKYVQLVTKMAALLDREQFLADEQDATDTVAVVKVHYRPVLAHTWTLRGEKQHEAGLTDLLHALWEGANNLKVDDSHGLTNPLGSTLSNSERAPASAGDMLEKKTSSGRALWLLADAETNSIILRGDPSQIRDARRLIQQLDRQRQQVQLSLKVVDIKESEVDNLGIDWSGSFREGGVTALVNPFSDINTVVSTRAIMTKIHLLTQRSKARIVSRPMVLTQDNVTAYFDNSQSFYIKLEAERFADLKTITYGTLISANPRIIKRLGQIPMVEMQLIVEDGSRDSDTNSTNAESMINQTRIETLARVPSGSSLLIGGYTRSERVENTTAVPGLSRIPFIGVLFRDEQPRQTNVVRLFLIEPIVLNEGNNSEFRLEEWLKQVRHETKRSLL